MRGIYLTVASIIPTGMYGMVNWHAAEGYCEDSLLAKTVGCRDGDLTSGHNLPRVSSDQGHGMHVTAAQVKNKINRTLSRGGPAVRSRIPRET
jgi:hypothetical protein